MSNISLDFSQNLGKIKRMNAVNNGPCGSVVRGTYTGKYFRQAHIPYARTHDSSFFAGYGGEFTVDVHRIFENFDADENDPKSYLFEPTDTYIKQIVESGTKVFYRLGASIEHYHKKGTHPPKDFQKWARVCEHIIRHYTRGWANGFRYNIEYWEIWNEPECENADGSNPCWQGTREQFVEFYRVALKYLKEKFPKLKIGGPAFLCGYSDLIPVVLKDLKDHNVDFDFISYHVYSRIPEKMLEEEEFVQRYLKEAGFEGKETILNEWNYVKGWSGKDFTYTIKKIKEIKGASFVASVMLLCQTSTIDMLMYYDARPSGFNGMFNTDTFEPLPTYYTFKAFGELYRLGSYVGGGSDDKVYYNAAKNGEKSAIMLTYYEDKDKMPNKTVSLDLKNIDGEKTAKIYVADKKKKLRLVKKVLVKDLKELELKLFDIVLIKIA